MTTPPAPAWRTIESAPLGERALIYNPATGVKIARISESVGRDGLDCVLECQWDGSVDACKFYPVPTHWMPLPSPPKDCAYE